jgi:phenylacetaldehyde dehydrogenase
MQAMSSGSGAPGDAFFSRPQRNLVGRERVPALSGREWQVHDPSTGRVLMSTPDSAREDVDHAVRVARRAFESGPWPRLSPYERSRLMLRFADAVEAHQEELARIEAIDAGKPLTQARYVDVPLALHQLHFYAGLVTKTAGRTITPSVPYMSGTTFHAYSVREPVGVAGLITPFNFPLLLAAMKVAPALAAGCTMVLKPDERAPGSSLRLAELALEAGIPEGVLNVVCGGPTPAPRWRRTRRWTRSPSPARPRPGATSCARRGETSRRCRWSWAGTRPASSSATPIWRGPSPASPRAPSPTPASAAWPGRRVFVEDAVYDQVMAGLVKHATGLKIGAAGEAETELGPLITEEHREKVLGYLDGARAGGAQFLTGGKTVGREGYFLEPTVVVDARRDTPFMRDEVFGPVAKVVRFRDPEEAIAQANDSVYGLAAGLWTTDVSKAHRVAAALKAGTVWVNCYNVFDTALPFGGYKQSGWGRESSPETIELYTELKTVCVAL